MGHDAFLITMIARGTDRSAIATFSTATERSNTATESTGNPFPAVSGFNYAVFSESLSKLVWTSIVPE